MPIANKRHGRHWVVIPIHYNTHGMAFVLPSSMRVALRASVVSPIPVRMPVKLMLPSLVLPARSWGSPLQRHVHLVPCAVVPIHRAVNRTPLQFPRIFDPMQAVRVQRMNFALGGAWPRSTLSSCASTAKPQQSDANQEHTDTEQKSSDAPEEQMSAEPEKSPSRWRVLWRRYGAVAVVTYIGVYVGTLGAMYGAVTYGILGRADAVSMVEYFGLEQYLIDANEVKSAKTKWAVAWLLTKLTEPLRAALTVAITPPLARTVAPYLGLDIRDSSKGDADAKDKKDSDEEPKSEST